MKTILQIIKLCQEKIEVLEGMIPVQQYQTRMAAIDSMLESSGFWNDSRNASAVMKERQKISSLVDKFLKYKQNADFNAEYAESYPGELDTISVDANILYEGLSQLEFQLMMQDPADDTPAILSISAGAGGSEAASWVTMLLRMYTRYAESYKFSVELLDMKPSEDHSTICTDTATIRIEGPYAYGFLKGESGIHRLVRQSPFSAADARHTSFAAVQISPDIEDTINIKIDDKDIDITAQRGSGAGGQHRNVTNSAIRLRHLPTGINILVQTERDFHANKRTAFKMLKAKLYDLEVKKRKEISDEQIDNLSNVSFGHQIKSYILSPYQIVKDHRTGYENNNADKVLDGYIHDFLLSYLKWNVNK